MKPIRYILYGLGALPLLLTSCEKDLSEAFASDQADFVSTKSPKIVHQNAVSDESVLMFQLKSATDLDVLSEIESIGLYDIKPVFPSTPGKEELEHQFGLDRWYVASVPEGLKADSAVSLIAEMEEVSFIEHNLLFNKASDCITYPYEGSYPSTKTEERFNTFNDPSLADQWNYANYGNASIATTAYKGADINVKDVWSSATAGDPSIIVAVIDEGVKYSHPDLRDNMWTNPSELNGTTGVDDDGNGYVDDIYGYNFVDNGPITWDKTAYINDQVVGDSGHGTHCAGTIAAVNNNGIGVCGVAGGTGNNDGVKIMSCQIFSANSGGSAYDTARAIKYAADMGASVISCSFGYRGGAIMSDGAYKAMAKAEADALYYFEASCNNDVLDGNIAIFATGNDGLPYATYPGAMHDIISVSAFGPDFLPTFYTNYGPGCNITAPGGEAYLPPWTSARAMILSTLPSEVNEGEDYGYMQGTSMACPHVTGVAALGLSYARKVGKKFSRDKFKEMLVSSANDFDTRLNAIGKKEYAMVMPPLNLAPYRKQMGSGSVDSWIFMMKIEGIPCLTASIGKKQWLDISEYFGTSSVHLTYLDVSVSDEDRASLGLAEDPYVQYGRLYVHPTKMGSAKIRIRAIAGGTEVGGDDKVGGMEVEQEISIIARSAKSENGAWL